MGNKLHTPLREFGEDKVADEKEDRSGGDWKLPDSRNTKTIAEDMKQWIAHYKLAAGWVQEVKLFVKGPVGQEAWAIRFVKAIDEIDQKKEMNENEKVKEYSEILQVLFDQVFTAFEESLEKKVREVTPELKLAVKFKQRWRKEWLENPKPGCEEPPEARIDRHLNIALYFDGGNRYKTVRAQLDDRKPPPARKQDAAITASRDIIAQTLKTIKTEALHNHKDMDDEAAKKQLRLCQRWLLECVIIWRDVLDDMLAMVRAEVAALQAEGKSPGPLSSLETELQDRLTRRVIPAMKEVDEVVDPDKRARLEREKAMAEGENAAKKKMEQEAAMKEEAEQERRKKEEEQKKTLDEAKQKLHASLEKTKEEYSAQYKIARSKAGLPW